MKTLIILLILLLKFQTTFSQSISSDSLVLHIPFDGNAKDVSGNNYDGIVNGARLTTGEQNMPNTAYYFDGKSSIVIPNVKKLDRPLKAFTVLIKLMVTNLDEDSSVHSPYSTSYNFLCWHRNSPDSGNAFLFSKLRTNWSHNVDRSQNNPYLSYNMTWCNISDSYSGYNKDSTRILNKWHTIAYVYSDASMKVYHNCSLMNNFKGVYPNVSELCGTAPMQISLGNVPLNAFKSGYRYFKGKIDDLQIYTRALSEDEVKEYADSLCAAPVVRFSIRKDSCTPSIINFTDVSDLKGERMYNRRLEIDRVDIDTARSFHHTFTNKGNYRVKMTIFTHSITSYSFDTLITIESTSYIKFLSQLDTTVSVCRGSNISLNLNSDAVIKWNPCAFLSSCDSSSVKITPLNDIAYTVTGINKDGCINTANVKVHVLSVIDSVYIPNAFTPNDDRLNDTFGPLSRCYIKTIDLKIYNHWGSVVFSSNQERFKWDGTFHGIAQPTGVYIYTLKYLQGEGCDSKQKKGTVQLIR